jgi:hypothetical protein
MIIKDLPKSNPLASLAKIKTERDKAAAAAAMPPPPPPPPPPIIEMVIWQVVQQTKQ